MQLSEHFSFEELTASEVAARHRIDNTPPISFDANLRHLAEGLEDVRAILGDHPMHITSGYRCHALNKLVNGQWESAHLQGLAADFICPAFGPPRKVCQAIVASGLNYQQVILEFHAWTHIAFPRPGERGTRQALIIDGRGAMAWA